MSVTIRIPTVKYLTDVLDQIESIDSLGQYSFDINIVVQRWSDELELHDQTKQSESEEYTSGTSILKEIISKGGESRKQMEQLRQHLRGE